MSLCGTILQGAEYDCANPLQAGLLPYIMLINTDDIHSISYNGNIITDIALKPGKTAYLFDSIRGAVSAQYDKKESIITGYEQTIDFQVFDISAKQKKNLERLALGKVIAITFLENNQGNYNTFFEVYGVGAGLQTQAITRIPKDQETQGSFSITIQTPEDLMESHLPYTFFDTDYDTTWQKIFDLLVAGENTNFPYVLPFALS